MKNLNFIHLGVGRVGKEVVRLIWKFKDKIKEDCSINLNYCGLFNSQGGIFDPEGLTDERLISFPQNSNTQVEAVLEGIKKPFVLIDTTASDETFPYLISALKHGGGVVLSNKKPLSSTYERFDELQRLGKDRLFYETTVGAGLPIISTLKDLIDTGDEILEVKGCFSGTLGFIFSQLDKGKRFSESVLKAKEMGFTEPDPRDDLSGLDVARKAIILARMIGQKIELSDIKLEKLYKKEMENMSIDGFLNSINQMDDGYKKRFEKEKKIGKTLRFVASISKSGCRVGMESVAKDSDLGSLKGPDNMIVFKTKRYFDHPLVIKGPGAGPEITASGVFADLLKVASII